MQVQALTDVNQRLQSSLADTTKAHQAERLKRDNLHKQVMHACGHCIYMKLVWELHSFNAMEPSAKGLLQCLRMCCRDHSKLNNVVPSCQPCIIAVMVRSWNLV